MNWGCLIILPPQSKISLAANLLTLFLACSIDLAFWEVLHEMRGNTNDQISLQFGKTDAMSRISHFILYKSLAYEIKPKSLPPQCIRIKWGGSCNVDKYLSFLAMSVNFNPPYPCHHNLMPRFSNPKPVPSGLVLVSRAACLIIEEPTIHTLMQLRPEILNLIIP